MTIFRTNSENQDFVLLIQHLDAYLKITDGDEHAFYNQFNNIDVIKNVVVVYADKKPVGCGAIKKFDKTTVEVKRMFVTSEKRGLGVAQKIIKELETWSKEFGYKKCVLETGLVCFHLIIIFVLFNWRLILFLLIYVSIFQFWKNLLGGGFHKLLSGVFLVVLLICLVVLILYRGVRIYL